MGSQAAGDVADCMLTLLKNQVEINVIFAAAPSQIEFLEALSSHDLPWGQINAFHMDEYVGLDDYAPQGFGNFLKQRLFSRLPLRSVHYLDGNASDPLLECKRYASLLALYPTDIVCMGIGENGHIAFNDPPVANFNDPLSVKPVILDLSCREQQVNDGCFTHLENVPERALTLTIPALMRSSFVFAMVPGKSKANAVNQTLYGPVKESCPASILRQHLHAQLYLDKDSANLLS